MPLLSNNLNNREKSNFARLHFSTKCKLIHGLDTSFTHIRTYPQGQHQRGQSGVYRENNSVDMCSGAAPKNENGFYIIPY